MNLPPGVSQTQIDLAYGFSEGGDTSSPNRQECFLCKRMLQQDPDTGWWFVEDESGWVPTHKSDFTDAFLTQQGMCCGKDCWNEIVALNEDESIPVRPVLFLVKAVTA